VQLDRQQFVETVGRLFNVPVMAASVSVVFHLLARLSGVRGADYFYDRSERVWVVNSRGTYIAIGFRVSRLWPWVVHRLVETRLADSRDYWYFHKYAPQVSSIIFDVGAGDGTDTVVFARSVGATGRVFAIEAHPRTARLLRATCRHNQFQNVTIIETAIMSSVGTLTMSDENNHEANHVVRKDKVGNGAVTDVIAATTLDAICRTYEISHIDFLKMNIEGAEVDAIKGMTDSIMKVSRACIACHDFITSDADEPIKNAITTYMKSNGFEVFTRDTDERPWARDHVHGKRYSEFAGG
jgi:FkbM family methyltransferase